MKASHDTKKATKQSIVLGIFFMLTYLTYLSFSNIITFIDEHQQGQEADGPIILAVTNTVFLVALFFTPAIKNFKKQFQISSICHLITYALFIPDLRGDLNLLVGLIGGIFTGYGGAIYWVSQGGYMMKLFHTCGIQQNQEGKYFAILNGITSICNLLGAVVTTFGLGLFGKQIYFTILTVLAFMAWIVCTYFLDDLDDKKEKVFIIKYDKQIVDQKSAQTQNEVNNIQSIAQEKEQIFSSQNQQKCMYKQRKLIKSIFIKTMSYYPKMYYIILVVVIDGIMLGFTSIYLNKLLPQNIRTSLNVGYLLMVQGVGCTIGSVTSAYASDRYNVINVIVLGIILICTTCLATFFNQFLQFESLIYPFTISFLWGFTNSYIESWQAVSCAKINKGSLQSFSIMQQISGITYVLFTVAMIITNNQINTTYFFVSLTALGIISIVVLLYFKKNMNKIKP